MTLTPEEDTGGLVVGQEGEEDRQEFGKGE